MWRVPDPPDTLLSRFVQIYMERLSSVVICGNAAFLGYAAEYAIAHLDDPMPTHVQVGNWLFFAYYMIELVLKLIVHKHYFFFNCDAHWNWFDVALILSSAYDQAYSLWSPSQGGSSGVMRLFRLFKMAKLLRILRVMKFFRELHLLLAPLLGSVRQLFWTLIMLALMLYIFGVIFLQAAGGALLADLDNHDLTKEAKDGLVEHWSSVDGAMLTLYMAITGGNDWADMAKPLKSTGVQYYWLFLFYIAFLTFAVLNILTGIFVDAAMTADSEAQTGLGFEDRTETTLIVNVETSAREIGYNPEDTIDLGDLTRLMRMPEFHSYMIHFEISDVMTRHIFLEMSGNGMARVQLHFFLTVAGKLKGAAKSQDMLLVLHPVNRLMEELNSFALSCTLRLDELSKRTEKIHHTVHTIHGPGTDHSPAAPKAVNSRSAQVIQPGESTAPSPGYEYRQQCLATSE
eukprot:gnl/TRDRNA2_/TRDRNA2_172431_c2_seq4.p1 gnl/TRDRNA2_/TRDRNA2_172431_c2~~gnl/TRDRNA2_/TRDRNA2_172431_c2_seq4.p1  ORF type:complete len:496 (+),score=56.05 gnl/TRDRNA2_/TRDRNA2_172431_c2_seq4:115-1488(+)